VVHVQCLNPYDTVVSACRPTTCWTFRSCPVPKVSYVTQNKHVFIITPIFVVSTSSCWGSTEFLCWVAGLRIPDVSKKRNAFALKRWDKRGTLFSKRLKLCNSSLTIQKTRIFEMHSIYREKENYTFSHLDYMNFTAVIFSTVFLTT